jgi:hypothetical protein
MKFYLYILLLIFCAINIVNAGTIDPSVPDTKYVDYGSKFDCIGQLCGIYDNGTFFCGSAVVIQEHIVLTAAHVVKNYKACHVKIKDQTYDIVKVIPHPDFTNKLGDGGDIAICFVKQAIKLDFYPELYSESDELDKVCSIAGYGLTGTFITGAKKSDSKKRAGSNVIDNIYNDLLVCSISQNDKRKTALEFLIGSGDSGGGLFIGNKLAGINSCVLADDKKPDSGYSDESGHTRISKYRKWILNETR